jgi:hypothetical protein
MKSRSRKRSNSPTFYKRLKKLSKGSRVPARNKKEDPSHHSDLFTDENPVGTVHNLRFRTEKEAIESVKRVKQLVKNKKITHAHAVQIALTMSQRSKYHAHPTEEIKKAHKIWKEYVNNIVKK